MEGIDGSGSTTQVRTLAERLRARGQTVQATREPSDGRVGTYLRSLLKGEAAQPAEPATMALLFAADRRDHLDQEILPALARGEIVLSDRYLLSSLAYQGCLLQDLEWVRALNRTAPAPDLTFLLDLPVEVAAGRRAERAAAELYEVDELLRRVASTYRELSAEAGAVLLDGTLPPTRLTAEIEQQVLAALADSCSDGHQRGAR